MLVLKYMLIAIIVFNDFLTHSFVFFKNIFVCTVVSSSLDINKWVHFSFDHSSLRSLWMNGITHIEPVQ